MCQESALVERPSCSSTRNHSSFDQPWPPCSGGVQPAGQPGLDRLALDALVQLVGDVAAGALGQLLVRDQHLVDEAPRALLQLELLGGEVRGRSARAGAGGADRHGGRSARVARPGRPSFSWWWLCIDVERRARAPAPSSASARDRSSQADRLGEVRSQARLLPRVTSRSARARARLHRGAARGAAGPQRGDRDGQLPLGLRGEGEPCLAGAEDPPERWYHATDHKVRIADGDS